MMAGSHAGKILLSNHLRHAESHNKLKEVKKMWQQREVERKKERFCDDWSFRASLNIAPVVRGHLLSDNLDHSTSSPSPPSSAPSSPLHHHHHRHTSHTHHRSSPAHSSNYWTRQLMKAEESDPFRWGHSGYKEQHPDEFVSSESDGDTKSAHKKVKKKKKKAKKEKKKKDGKRRERLSSSCERRSVSRHKRKKRRRSSSHPRTRESDSSSSSPSTSTSRARKRKKT